jgi:hypothetical protein
VTPTWATYPYSCFWSLHCSLVDTFASPSFLFYFSQLLLLPITMPLTKNQSGNHLSSIISTSSSDLTGPPASTAEESGRASPHGLLLPDRTATAPITAGNGANAPWMPPQHNRSSSGQVRRPYNQHLSPLAPPAEIQRKPVAEHFVRDVSSQQSLHPSSATSSPVNSSRPASMYSSQPSSPFQPTPSPHSAADLQPHNALSPSGPVEFGSPTTGKLKRKSWFGGNKHAKKEEEEERRRTAAWIVGHDHQQTSYDLQPLVNAQRVSSSL